ncbi:cytochrome c-type biogenesis protein [Carboxydocella sporoproducens DSM 16521]|uniref:Cytochrome c-type biogenesis protein n=2 Tax=Carboxydocella TaxID=178898 RepID=A0A1T4MWG6_9FIRM|nr:cytochrome c-type biogenesis protein [Carboxydocella thermautotrophica]AVX30718.1 cytochrome c-type biogenesis protein [Carboxydocella thermautotrophica]SJZ71362.1 cytochrome c-type biogenesis protein [Carboxydocella sporoproducens DSM 16521]
MLILTNVSGWLAFAAGVVSFASPCVLPLIPAYVAYLAGSTQNATLAEGKRLRLLTRALLFILGFSLLFILLGASASAVGKLLLQYKDILRRISGALIIIFGLFMTGLLPLEMFYREVRWQATPRAGGLGAFLLGLAFAAGWTPCVGPILSSILLYASTEATVNKGIYLLSLYSLGLGLPFLVTALAVDKFQSALNRMARFLPVVSLVAGVIMIILGILIFTNKLGLIAGYFSWLAI